MRQSNIQNVTNIRCGEPDYGSLAHYKHGREGRITTNFDVCLPRALNDKQPHIRHIAEVNRAPDDFNEFSLYARAQVVWLHGKAEQYTDRNLIGETQALDPALVEALKPLLESAPLVVVGYRGAEPSIMESLLGANTTIKFRHGIFWCRKSGDSVHPHVEALAQRLGKNFQYLDIDGFDELLSDLNRELAGVQRFAIAMKDGQPFGIGCIWENRKDPAGRLDSHLRGDHD
jgi:SIR2-like domain